jgi:hypothetical protein
MYMDISPASMKTQVIWWEFFPSIHIHLGLNLFNNIPLE